MQGGNMKLVFDIDGVVCTNTWGKYEEATPIQTNIDLINQLYSNGNTIIFFTARGYETKIDHRELTEMQLKQWGIKYHKLIFGKPSADYYIDDKALKEDKIKWLLSLK